MVPSRLTICALLRSISDQKPDTENRRAMLTVPPSIIVVSTLAMALILIVLPTTTHTGRVLLISVAAFGLATVLFGASDQEASNLADAYRRFHAKNVGVEDILRTKGNAVLLWQLHPSAPDESNVEDCLK